jgi:hypothetical protein
MMLAVPAVTPLAIPPVVTVAIVVGMLLHAPPLVASLSAVVVPLHIFRVPVMAAAPALTVTTAVTVQPDGSEPVEPNE